MPEFVYDTPTASIFDDLPQWVGLLLGAVDNGLDSVYYWDEADYESEVKGYLEDVRAWIAELPDMLNGLTPVGGVIAFAGATPPANWLLCDGTEAAEIDYPELATAIGATGGIITLPDLRGRTAVGTGTGVGLTARTLLAAFGNETHTLTIAEMPAHDHPQRVRRTATTTGTNDRVMVYGTGGTDGLTNNTIDDAGGGAAHNNVQPSLALNYIIRAK